MSQVLGGFAPPTVAMVSRGLAMTAVRRWLSATLTGSRGLQNAAPPSGPPPIRGSLIGTLSWSPRTHTRIRNQDEPVRPRRAIAIVNCITIIPQKAVVWGLFHGRHRIWEACHIFCSIVARIHTR